MGSSGFGKFGTYDIDRAPSSGSAGKVGSAGNAGGELPEIECPRSIVNIMLEDVAISQFFKQNHSLPNVGANVFLDRNIFKGRLVVKLTDSSEILGNLPTQYNYLINCLSQGLIYEGNVVSSGGSPVPYIVISLYAR